jgi:hypothetical protein
MLHNFIESCRFSLMIFAVPIVISAYRRRLPASSTGRSLDRLGILATALAVILLPFCFPAGLPRYMMSSLPPLCVLAALGLSRLTPRQRLATATLLAAIFIGNWHGDSWHENPGFHLERNLDYRELLFLQRDAAQALAEQHPRGVSAVFPMYTVLSAPREDGYLAAPLPVHLAQADEPLSDLCKDDYLIESDGEIIKPLVQRMLTHHAGSLWREFGSPRMAGTRRLTPFWARRDQTIRIYRIQCPADSMSGR